MHASDKGLAHHTCTQHTLCKLTLHHAAKLAYATVGLSIPSPTRYSADCSVLQHKYAQQDGSGFTWQQQLAVSKFQGLANCRTDDYSDSVLLRCADSLEGCVVQQPVSTTTHSPNLLVFAFLISLS